MNTLTTPRTRELHVIEATGTADVRAAILTARDRGLPLTVQATGHGTHVPADEGVLLKTSRMARVLVDPSRGTARVGPGARWSDVIAAAAPLGLSPLSGSHASVGVTGYTLGGGVGWLARPPRVRRRPPAARRRRHRRRPDRDRRRPPQRRPVLGAARRRWQLRRRHVTGVPAPPGVHGVRGHRRLPRRPGL
ncbi:FAD-binding oxidoreductase [Actinomadura spongiicola]|uniref:FAD-binding oxidoreductase n=1 Tax=Actinomadura spongiicola TaxID=2303421 RepID=A0A372G6S2_9ACTN|nr:FAD-dependent oxidoreductase [Actinomadura spongiicola]RFS80997.1 FAD-binding oxidoreductase [Actinomadura spongiicola]